MLVCEECKKTNTESTVMVRGTFKTALGYFPEFFDSKGDQHKHDENTNTTHYQCSAGHGWSKKSKTSCPCGWPDSGPFKVVEEKE